MALRAPPRSSVRRPPGALRVAAALAALAAITTTAVFAAVRGGTPHRVPPAAPATHRVAAVPSLGESLFPFKPSAAQRVPTVADALPEYWADGLPCSVGCRPAGAIDGWPLRPFHREHPLRAGLNELRNSGFHVGIDIQATDGSRVYAIQRGRAKVLQTTGVDSRVRVGNFIYWHVRPAVWTGERVVPYETVVGRVNRTAGHLHLSEVSATGAYLSSLRPGGRVLTPWRDADPPVIGPPQLASDGTAVVSAFDPQSTREHTTYDTPVLAPAALAYAVFDRAGRRLGPLEWVIRGSHLLPSSEAALVYAPGAHAPGWSCFSHGRRCVPDWTYRLAGGLAPALTAVVPHPGVYRLSVYAWDWAGNTAARDVWFGRGLDGTITSFLK